MRPTHFNEGLAQRNHFFGGNEKSGKFRFSGRRHDKLDDGRTAKDWAIMAGNRVIFKEHDMGASADVGFADVEVGSIVMGSEDRVAGSVDNAVVGISCHIVKQLQDVSIGLLCGGGLLGANVAERNKQFFVDGLCVEQEATNNFLDALDTRGIQGRAIGGLSDILSLGSVVDINVSMGR